MAKNELSAAMDRLNATMNGAPDEVLEEVGQFATSVILLRTKKGLDADRKTFKPYSERYAKRRARKHLRIDPPDLVVKGHMLGAITPFPGNHNEIVIGFNAQHEADKAVWNTALGRDFFDVRADAEIEAIAEVIGDRFIAEIVGK